jgi:DNA-directed RNA polymerase subunit RPC12/RpoP
MNRKRNKETEQQRTERLYPHACPRCRQPNKLSNLEKQKGYQCADCTAREEGPL